MAKKQNAPNESLNHKYEMSTTSNEKNRNMRLDGNSELIMPIGPLNPSGSVV